MQVVKEFRQVFKPFWYNTGSSWRTDRHFLHSCTALCGYKLDYDVTPQCVSCAELLFQHYTLYI